MKFGRLINGELRKISLRPILYIVTAVLVLALILSVTLFSPTPRGDERYKIDGANISEVYSGFTAGSGNVNKNAYDLAFAGLLNTITYYEDINSDSELSFTHELKALFTVITNSANLGPSGKFEIYVQKVRNPNPGEWAGGADQEAEIARQELITAIKQLQLRYNTIAEATPMSVLIKYDDHIKINELLTSLINALDKPLVDYSQQSVHQLIVNEIDDGSYLTALSGRLNSIEDIIVREETLTRLNEWYAEAETRLLAQAELIEEVYATLGGTMVGNAVLQEYKNDIGNYYSTVDLIGKLVHSTITLEIIKDKNDAAIHQYRGFKDIYTYQLRESQAKAAYLFENNKFAYEYANVFSINRTSNAAVSAFDFIFFGLELFGFIILITCVVLGASSFAGESSSGTLKLLAIRPYTRNKLLTGKLLSTLIFGFILVIFGSIVLLLIGITLHWIDLTPILAVFNGTIAFAISPWLLMLIYIAQLLFKIFVYTLFAVCVSTLLRSNMAAVAISILVYFLSSLFSVIFSASYWYAYVPFTNIDLFKYFGGSFISGVGNSPLAVIFSTPMLYNMNFYISIGLSAALVIALFITTYIVFNKREIK
ncbi:MAG: ABC transporter permease [Firmicutes bacterium]|nr:ABC transporter permease [Bacillota bacterium]